VHITFPPSKVVGASATHEDNDQTISNSKMIYVHKRVEGLFGRHEQ
jgi:hypothetical protein